MKLSVFLKKIGYKGKAIEDKHILNGTFDSRKVNSGTLFFDFNEGKYVLDAIDRGCVGVVSKKTYDGIPCIVSDSPRRVFADFCACLYGEPKDNVKFIGVVGTNGKTSTVKILDHLLRACGYRTTTIGTLGADIDGREYSFDMTTPDSDVFYKIISLSNQSNVDFVIMEWSAHAIFLEKINVKFDYCIFTNLTQDHLDFFVTMEDYAEVKKSVFLGDRVRCAVVNVDDKLGYEIQRCREGKTITYGLNSPADTFAIDIKCDVGIRCIVNSCDRIGEIVTPLCGEHNLYNILGAVSICRNIGMDMSIICSALSTIPSIEGRYNVLYGKVTFIIDYAHTPNGLECVLTTAKKMTKKNLSVVFGCGGDRDREKRAIMGEIACALADKVVITSDNSRNEDTKKIIEDIVIGARKVGKNYTVITDREEAIKYAYAHAEYGDTILVAGKGAEEYIEEKGKKIPFSDKKICERLLEKV